MRFPVYTGVKVIDAANTFAGQTGCTVSSPDDPEALVEVKLDADNTIHSFQPSQLGSL